MKLKPYLIIMRNSMMAGLAYRGHFFFTLAGTLIYLVVSWFLWKAVYEHGGTIGGLTFTQAYLYVGISVGLFGLMQTATDWYLHNIVTSGDLLRFLTKPIDFPLQLFADALGGGIMNSLMIALPSIITVFAFAGAGVPPLINILLFLPAVILGFLINFFFDFLTGLSVFLTQSITGVALAKEAVVVFLSGMAVPLAFFPVHFRRVLEWLPFQALYHTPVRLLTDSSLGTDEVLIFFLRQVIWFCVFYLLVRFFFSAALRKLVVNGG